ncbi:MAG TPA: hypothetical protein VFQ06_01615 [Nitrospira sp.]|nr:hypothetical protein [Nitrospira sp.]
MLSWRLQSRISGSPARWRIHPDHDHSEKQQMLGVRHLDPEVVAFPDKGGVIAQDLTRVADRYKASIVHGD